MKALKVWCSYTNLAGAAAGFSFKLSTPQQWDAWSDTEQGDWAGNQCLERMDLMHQGRPYSFDFGYEFLAEGESGNGLASSGKD